MYRVINFKKKLKYYGRFNHVILIISLNTDIFLLGNILIPISLLKTLSLSAMKYAYMKQATP